ncbi:MAG: hypothetical protein ACTJFY_01615 [Candidatus Corynebacterium faecigallinarum]
MSTFRKHNPGRTGDWEAACLSWLDDAADGGGAPVAEVVDREGDDLLLRRVPSTSATKDAAEQFGRRLAATHAAGAPHFGSGPATWEGSGYQGPNDHLLELPLPSTPVGGASTPRSSSPHWTVTPEAFPVQTPCSTG